MNKDIRHSLYRFTLIGGALAAALAASGGAEAWGQYGNPYGNDSNSARIYSPSGQFRGNLNDNRYDSNSVSNPYGRYGNPYSSESINNPYGAGNPYAPSVPAIRSFGR